MPNLDTTLVRANLDATPILRNLNTTPIRRTLDRILVDLKKAASRPDALQECAVRLSRVASAITVEYEAAYAVASEIVET